MTADMGMQVPSNVVRVGGNTLVQTIVADAALSPTNCVKYDTSNALVIPCGVDDEYCIGVADLNYQGIADEEDPMTHAFADGEKVPIIMNGLVVAVADTGASTRGYLQVVGAADGKEVEDTGGVTWEPTVVGRAMTSAASTAKLVLKLF